MNYLPNSLLGFALPLLPVQRVVVGDVAIAGAEQGTTYSLD